MNSEKLIFEKKTEHRGWYFVEYSPPVESLPFASINLVILEVAEKNKIAEAMEIELRTWLERYPIPAMVSAFDDKGNLIQLDTARESDFLMGCLSKENESPNLYWRLLKDEELPTDALSRDNLIKIYHDIPFRKWTGKDVQRVKRENKQMVFMAWLILFVWLVAIPLTIIVLGETSVWVARMVLAYSLWKVFVQVMKLLGKWGKSKREEVQEREDLEKSHHHYHCKRNPQGFLRLKIENFEREAQERVHKEAEALKRNSSQPKQDSQ